MKKATLVLFLIFVSLPLFARNWRNSPSEETPSTIQVIDRACVKPAVTGDETTVVIRSVRGAEFYPVRDALILALQRAGYTVLSPRNARLVSEGGSGRFGSGQSLSDFLRNVYGSGPGFEASSSEPQNGTGDLPEADYYLEETTTWISGEGNFHGLSGSAGGFYGGYRSSGTDGELRVSIAMFDGEGRAVPGKVSEAVIHLTLRRSWNNIFIVFSFANTNGRFRSLIDPATEATIQIIPHMFAGGAR